MSQDQKINPQFQRYYFLYARSKGNTVDEQMILDRQKRPSFESPDFSFIFWLNCKWIKYCSSKNIEPSPQNFTNETIINKFNTWLEEQYK